MSVTVETPPSASSSRNSDRSVGSDESLLEISFEYAVAEDGKVIRISKGSRDSPRSAENIAGPSPPTPPYTQELALLSSALSGTTLLDAPERRRSSLSRSESMPGADALIAPSRSLSRTASGPVNLTTPGQPARSATYAPLSGGLQGTGRKIGGAQRIRKDEADRQRRELDERLRKEVEEAERVERERARRAMEEKENTQIERHSPPHGSRQIASLPLRQNYYKFPKLAHSGIVSTKKSNVPKINEVEGSEEDYDHVEYGNHNQHQYLQKKSPPEKIVDYDSRSLAQPSRTPSQYGLASQSRSYSVSGTSAKARRVTVEERLRQEQEIAEEEALTLERERAAVATQVNPRQSPSPTHKNIQGHHAAAHLRHHRRDSDTLRSGLPVARNSQDDEANEQYEHELQHEEAQRPQRLSPPPQSKSAASNFASSSNANRRSPTGRDILTVASVTLVEQDEQHDSDNGRPEKSSIPRSQSQSLQQQVGDIRPRNLIVNRKPYARLDMIGKGGSSRVYRVMSSANEIYAIKRVSLDKTDADTINGYMNEIALLKRLGGNSRIIKLVDSEVKGGLNGNKGYLMLVMECGEVDLAKLIQEQQKEAMNMVWIAYYWQQILQCVNIIHEEKIVHSDLKPANFVLVRGQLKLIDFGIANAIANDTTNIQRDHQIGTVNYMSPEAIEVPDGLRRLKVGRPSDVWSLGCILYQMVYGHPPFHHLDIFQKMKAIPNKDHIIEFPEITVPTIPSPRNPQKGSPSAPQRLEHLARPVRKDVIETMKRCLIRAPKERVTIPELLEDEWLAMKEDTPAQAQKAAPQLKLKDDETIINPFYMRQLLDYAYRCAKEGRVLTDAEQVTEAERLVQELKSIS